jgi:hypothetical protein
LNNRTVLTVIPHPSGGWVVGGDLVATKDQALALAHEAARRYEHACVVVYGWSGKVESAVIHGRPLEEDTGAA